MIAMGRYLKKNYGEDKKIVFIGPCVAKKSEYVDPEVDDAVDAVLTFKELKEIFDEFKIDLESFSESEFDPPHANIGKSFPLTGGLLKTAEVSNDILHKETIIVEGKNHVVDLMWEIVEGKVKSKFVDILFCEGCINGPAIDSNLSYYSRREKVINYIQESINIGDKREWKSNIYNSRDLNLKREFHNKSQRKPMPSEEEIKEILARTNKYEKSHELNCGSCGYPSCREYAVAIAKGLAEEDMCLPYLIEKLESAYEELQETQEQLHSAEKLASIGQLAAGIAHEINNPLGTIMLYASMMKRKLEKTKCNDNQNTEDLNLIVEEANRCKNIVADLLNFARQGKLRIGKVDILEVVTNVIKVIQNNSQYSDINFKIDSKPQNIIIDADSDQVKQVFLNLINNACEALESSTIKEINVTIIQNDENIIINVSDTGSGIPQENLNKIFTPFFTTKKMGKGTGLGLAITYGIIKMHKGDIKVKSTVGKGTEFSIVMPIKNNILNPILN
jgi:nitrogen-specific signal transduction histidine kinase